MAQDLNQFDDFFNMGTLNKKKEDSTRVIEKPQKKVEEEQKKEPLVKEKVQKSGDAINLMNYFNEDVDNVPLHRTSFNLTKMQYEILLCTSIVNGTGKEGVSGVVREAIKEYFKKINKDEETCRKVKQLLEIKGVL